VDPIIFDVCFSPSLSPRSATEGERRAIGDRVQKVLSQTGVPAELTSVAGSPVAFTVTLGGHYDHDWSMWASLLTYSVVPGYMVERRTVSVDLASRDTAGGEKDERLEYEARTRRFIWLPLIVYPDFVASINGGWESAKSKDGGFEATVARLGDDLRARLGRAGGVAPTSPAAGVVCR
jgi:hypothetical protein